MEEQSLNLSSITKELTLLLEILKIEQEDNIVSFQSELFTHVDWDSFLQLAIHHRVYPVIYPKIKKLEDNRIPTYVIQTLYKEYKQNTFDMLHLSREMELVSKLFNENQIPLLFLKGPVIGAELYGDISLRTSKDLDMLIPMASLEKVEKALLSIGYIKDVVPNLLNDWKLRNHHIVYFHPQKNIQLEIHWRLQPLPMKEPKFNDLWERKRVSNITSYPTYFLGKDDLFLYLVSHGARHGWFRLRWLLDIDKIIRKGINVKKINLIQIKYKNKHLVGQAILLSSQLLNTPINKDIQVLMAQNRSKKLAQKAICFIKETNSLDNIMSTTYYKVYLFSLKSILQKFLSILILFYPRIADAKTLNLPKTFQFLYFPLRPFLWVWRQLTKP
ncbi:nucleotidyltransferase family protein [Peribacillus frigoritolerans]|uniref:nucleotidyltransferase domain-containing protein n=1 Tax=Peribacillus frigoritolerans TaxID=450367 RepID=UPI00207A6898|nr:nucleotidyltransferase family protein [Peribacillus frigoritolerans]USK78796.1 nucleotidyltransferase family protein [Peribacillus frigoritolerans]